jgi:hypothetical protein
MLDFAMRYSPKYGLTQIGSCIKRIPHSYSSILGTMPKMGKNVHRGGEKCSFWRFLAISGAIDIWKIVAK